MPGAIPKGSVPDAVPRGSVPGAYSCSRGRGQVAAGARRPGRWRGRGSGAGARTGRAAAVATAVAAAMAGSGARWMPLALCLAVILSPGRTGEQLHVCKESEYHYEYTACDSSGSRWRVAVPHTPGLCTGLPDPVRGTECCKIPARNGMGSGWQVAMAGMGNEAFSCKAGEFLEMQTQTCRPCAAGTYSLGTGVRFDEWDEVPHGFANVATNLEVDDGFGDAAENCTASTWVPLGDYVASNTDECTATLMYAVSLKQSGTVTFEYIYPDSSIVFEFFVQNDQCQPTVEESRWMRTTEKGWEFHSVELSRGNNVLYWRTTAFSVWSKVPKPVLVRNIGITGVAFTSECFPCKPGTFAPASGSTACQLCPADTFSGKGATACQPCDSDTYAEPGSGSCKPRPPCTDKDFFYTHTACDASGETQLMYKWAEPKICSEELPQAARLPSSGVKTQCPPCNPGFAKGNSSTCQPCPYGFYSNGSACLSCPEGTEPVLGLEYKWWNVLPPNMETTVLSGINFEYKGIAGWEVAGDYIYTAAGASDSDFMILTLVVPGFSPPSPVLEDTESREVARITFVFETLCSVGCELYFMVGVNSHTNTPVETWTGSTGKQSYTYLVEKNATVSFTWAFQRTPYHEALRSLCYNNCSLALALPGRMLHFEFPSLGQGAGVGTGSSFTPKGLRYSHHFHLSLCGHQGRKMASCADNVTAGLGGPARVVTSYVCQAILVPPDVTGARAAVSSQPISLGDHLLGVTTSSVLDGIVSPPELFPPSHPDLPDIIFFFRSNDMTQPCSSGRATTIRLRCDPLRIGTGTLAVPSKCPEGTCDGCTFHFLWVTAEGCPRCSSSHHRPIVGACIGGVQKTTYVWQEPRLCHGGDALPPQVIQACRSVDFWLKVGISTGTCAAVLLAALAAYFWKKTQKLEYKYSKLVMDAAARETDATSPDSCAIMEGEDAEDELLFATEMSLFGKLKALTAKRMPDGFDSVPLKTSSSSIDREL
ncbi:endosome/lysosome-associated apoptosis and autophagy regulator 1 isoform X5 [Haemorhous mexicanus]|uniref:endosome/lysosome-associated apoptosis and autophagy regulator 1 isoform X5 n=1 Tax=Haemorhous mexicanus TaxID=30427 RepID=UPI0028BF1AC6|nr:endosome/lysosome-associated apoptosis and autophagy regulator 1 isoform X5 [Haemorhous mexicanus]